MVQRTLSSISLIVLLPPHPNAHTDIELTWIKNYLRRNPHISMSELYGKLRTERGYSRHACSLFRVMRKMNYFVNKEKHENYVPKYYDTPTALGVKWQLDVKYVPKQCYSGTVPQKFFQYTIIDEASRERFIYPYMEQSSYSTINFVKRAILYFGYQPKIIQTDNGSEFSNIKKTDRIHPFDVLCSSLNIEHKLIKPRTPRHNGKVERSHRNDQNRFYNYLSFYSYDDLKQQMKSYLKRSNHIPMQILGWISPFEKIFNDFQNSKFVVCTDAGLASASNRKFNNTNNRRFVTTQSLKKLKTFLKEWSLDLNKGWKLFASDKTYDISKLREDENLINNYKDKIFYKERWIKEDDLEQRLIITFSPKYQEYQKQIRNNQIQRALKLIEKNPNNIGKVRENDPKRFISNTVTTKDGEVAEENNYSLNLDKINDEAKYDGLYAVCTNLEDSAEEIININKRRWEIEESFRIMKSEFKARPVYLSRDDRVKAHFTTCFLALTLFRYLEKKITLNDEEKERYIKDHYTVSQIIETLKSCTLRNIYDIGYEPEYKRTELTDLLHKKFGFNTDYEIIENKTINKIINNTKN